MKNRITGICSLLINISPFLIYPMLITQHNGKFINFVPFAIYYAFRRTALVLFRDWEHNFSSLGKIGLFSGLLGSVFGLFGILNPAFWDISGIGIGLASTLFSTAINQNQRLMRIKQNDKKKPQLGKSLMTILIVLALMATIMICHSAFLNFLFLLIVNVMALYAYQYRSNNLIIPTHFYWKNYLLGTLLFLSMFSIRIARSTGIEQSITWGIALLGIFLLLMSLLLINNWQGRTISPNFKSKAVFFGICGQYWTMYSVIFIGALYGMHLYYWTVVMYLLAMVLGPICAKVIFNHTDVDQISLSLILTIIGIALTFWLPTYFLGVFLIRTFTNQVRLMTTSEYERQTHNYHLSYIVNYNYATVSGMTSQFVMWISLLLLLHNQGLSRIFLETSESLTSINNVLAITGAHIILAIYMIFYSIILLINLQRKDKSTKKLTK